MRGAVRHFSTFRGLVGILTRSMYDEGTPSHSACSAMHSGGARLLKAAQDSGQVREDLTPDELFDLMSGAAWVRENAPAAPRRQPAIRPDDPGRHRDPPVNRLTVVIRRGALTSSRRHGHFGTGHLRREVTEYPVPFGSVNVQTHPHDGHARIPGRGRPLGDRRAPRTGE